MNQLLFRITVVLSTTVAQTRGSCVQFKNFVHDLKDEHFMKFPGRKWFPSRHDILSLPSRDFRKNECMQSLDLFFLVSCLPHRSLLQSQTVTVLCASPRHGSSWNISLILLMKTLFTSDMSAVLVKRFKPFFLLYKQSVSRQQQQMMLSKNNLLVSIKICWLVPRNSSLQMGFGTMHLLFNSLTFE